MRPTYTEHALERIGQMRVDREEVAAALRDPEMTYDGRRDAPPARHHVGGRLDVVANVRVPEHPLVLTVLWRDAEGRCGTCGAPIDGDRAWCPTHEAEQADRWAEGGQFVNAVRGLLGWPPVEHLDA